MSNERKTPAEDATAEALLDWIDAFPTKQLERRLAALLMQRRDLDVEIRFLQNQLLRYRQYLEDLRPGEAGAPATPSRSRDAGQRTTDARPAKRLAVLRLLSETPGRTWRLSDLRDELTKRGWLEDSDKARHALQVTMLSMAKRGEIEKPRTGFYRIATDGSLGRIDAPGVPPSRDSVPGESEGGTT